MIDVIKKLNIQLDINNLDQIITSEITENNFEDIERSTSEILNLVV
jgi:hypothetical protein